jgi:hypothetical protein
MTNTIWETVQRQPGYFGAKREEKHAAFDQTYGVGQWRIAWELPIGTTSLVLSFEEMCRLCYEEAYVRFLSANPDLLAELIQVASNVYDDAVSNIASGFCYSAQETGRTHVQDIAIRCALARLGTWFQGDQPIQIRAKQGEHRLSPILSPGDVPFHLPESIVQPQVEKWWWKPDSVEAFYQSNKIVQRML